ncbi:MAG: EpsG family protein [Prevotellaceae bacterium]|jgi:hypothetical protein|nr:EpsG family protein [Prevotellaceae bacterium]
MIYIVILIILAIPAFLYDICNLERGKTGFLVLEFILLVLLAGLRYRVGGDTLIYMFLFDNYPSLGELQYFDFSEAEFNPLWYIFNAVIISCGGDFITFQIIHAIIVNSVFFWFFRKHTAFYFSAILMYYFGYYVLFNMEVLREALAVCCFMIAYPLYSQKKYVKYYLCCIVAVSIHWSALFMLLIPLFSFILKNFKVKHLIIVEIALGVFLAGISIIPLILDVFSFNYLVSLKLERYAEMEVNIMNTLFYYVFTVPFILLLYFNNREENTDFQLRNMHSLVTLFVVLMVFSAFYNIIFSRLTNYLIPFVILYIVESVKYLNMRYKENIIYSFVIKMALVIILFFQSYYYWKTQLESMPDTKFYVLFHPYHSIFDPQIDKNREVFFENLRETSDF